MQSPEPIRVVVTGHTGLGKNKILNRLCNYINETIPERTAQYYCAEEHLGKPISAIFDPPLQIQQQIWKRSIGRAVAKWRETEPAPNCIFFSMHLTFQWHSHIFSPMSWKIPKSAGDFDEKIELEDTFLHLISEIFQPHYCINLIDDIQAVQARITRHHFRLRELLSWRDAEMMMTDLLAKYAIKQEFLERDQPQFPFERSPVIPIRHPLQMVTRYLFQPEIPRLYASFPIGSPRRVKDLHDKQLAFTEINDFRSGLHKTYCVFDPVTIDELPIRELLNNTTHSQNGTVRLLADAQWKIPASKSLCGESRRDYDMNLEDISEVAQPMGPVAKSEIARQVQIRDFRLIDQSDCVVIYRPTYNRKIWDHEPRQWSMGTYHEALHARTSGKPLLVVRDPKFDEELTTENIGIELSSEEVIQEIEDLKMPSQRKKVLERLDQEITRRGADLLSKRRL